MVSLLLLLLFISFDGYIKQPVCRAERVIISKKEEEEKETQNKELGEVARWRGGRDRT